MVAQKVKAGEELTVYYGPDYHRIGYSMAKNNHLDKPYPELEKVTLPTKKAVQKVAREAQGLPEPGETRTFTDMIQAGMTKAERLKQCRMEELLERLSSQ
jgi:hypothetical protein